MKWGKELYDKIEVNTDEPPIIFKAQLFELTGVSPDRQKVMAKGIVLKDESWDKVVVKDVSCISREVRDVNFYTFFLLKGDHFFVNGQRGGPS